MQKQYRQYIYDNGLLTIPASLDAIAARINTLLTTDVKTRKLISVSRETVKEALKMLAN